MRTLYQRRAGILSATLGVLLALGILPLAVQAQDKISLKIQPSLIEEKVDPGQVLVKSATITNFSSEMQTLYLSTRNVTDVTDTGQPVFANEGETTPYDVSNWVTFESPSIKLAPGESKLIGFVIKVPKDVGPGGHYGGVFFLQNPPDAKTSGTGVGYEVAMLLNMRVSGTIREEAQVHEFQTDKSIYGKLPVTFSTKIENLGNVIVRPRGPIDITNMFGKKVDTIRMNDGAAAVFPKATRAFKVDWDSNDVHFGKYTATMVLSYGDTLVQNTAPNVQTFWVLPAKIILPTLGFIVTFILLTWILMRLYVAKRLRELSLYGVRSEPRARNGNGGGGISRLTAIVIALLLSIIVMFALLFLFF